MSVALKRFISLYYNKGVSERAETVLRGVCSEERQKPLVLYSLSLSLHPVVLCVDEILWRGSLTEC